jgi:uncharacterized membrane protein
MHRLAINLRHFARNRPRLLIALVIALAGTALLPSNVLVATRTLIGWNLLVWSYLMLVAWLMTRADAVRVRAIAEREDPSAAAVLALLCFTAVASLAAIVLELASVRALAPQERWLHYALTGTTLAGSWLFVNALFTFHYARLYYRSPESHRPLRFPEEAGFAPDYWDFLYFSFTIAVAAQTSDVSITGRTLRKVALGQSVLGFLFNVSIIGLSINVAAGLIGS